MTQYTVQPGDTQYEIAKRHNITLEELQAQNPGLVDHVYDLQIGTVLNVNSGYTQPQAQYTPPETPPQTYSQPPPQQYQQEQQQDGGFWNSTGVKIAEGVLGAGALAGVAAIGIHQWKQHQRYTANAGQPAFTVYQSPRGPLLWRTVSPGGPIPQDAIILGRDSDNGPLYAARASLWGGYHIGKATAHGHVYISYNGKEETIRSTYDVLCGNPQTVTVIPQNGALNLQGLPNQPLDGGHESNGERLYVAIVEHEGTCQVGKCGPANTNGINFGWGGKELSSRNYKVVCIA